MKKFVTMTLFVMLVLSNIANAQDDRLQVVASHSILADVVSNVAGDVVDVSSTMPIGADPHAFVPIPSDITALADADIVFVNGAMFEEGLLEAIENAGTDMNIVTASSCIDMLAFGHADDDHADDEHADDDHDHALEDRCAQHIVEIDMLHGAGHDHDDEHADDEHDHSATESLGLLYAAGCDGAHDEADTADAHNHGACDPHVWTNPYNVMYWTLFIRDTLIDADPDNAETYQANASAYLEQLNDLTHNFIMPMVESVPTENRIIITSHESLGYFANHYGFDVIRTIMSSGSTLAEPSASDIADVINLITETGIPAIFGETTVSETIAEAITNETNAELYTLYTGTLSDTDGPASTYIDYMRYNVTIIVEALGGGM
jgi:ABC-type Zn uptake system ZnuABC Zn-binding protein ZnuA